MKINQLKCRETGQKFDQLIPPMGRTKVHFPPFIYKLSKMIQKLLLHTNIYSRGPFWHITIWSELMEKNIFIKGCCKKLHSHYFFFFSTPRDVAFISKLNFPYILSIGNVRPISEILTFLMRYISAWNRPTYAPNQVPICQKALIIMQH